MKIEDLTNFLVTKCKLYYSKNVIDSIKRNKHLNCYAGEPVELETIKAILVDFVNYLSASYGVDLSLHTKDMPEVKPFKLYVWSEFCPSYNNGLAFAIAQDVEEAKEIISKQNDCPGTIEWGPVEEFDIQTKNLLFMCNNYFTRQKRLKGLMNENISLNIRIKTMELLKKSFIKRLIFLFTRRFY